MANTSPLVLRLLASSVTAATRAGKIIRDIMSRGELGIVEKGINDLQTEADRSAQRCIIASLSQQYPDLTIVGEEGAINNCEVPSDWIVTDLDPTVISRDCPPDLLPTVIDDVVIWVDPLDGTSEYTQGLLDHVTVLIGLSVKGRAVGGVIHQPYYNWKSGEGGRISGGMGRTIWGLIGMGVGGFEPRQAPEGKLIVTTTRSHSDGTVQKALDALKPDEVLKVGGAGHKVMLLLEGRAHAYVFASKGCKKWDTCAPEAILRACDGNLTDIHGDCYSYHKEVGFPNVGGVFATIQSINHSELLAKIPQEVKDKLK